MWNNGDNRSVKIVPYLLENSGNANGNGNGDGNSGNRNGVVIENINHGSVNGNKNAYGKLERKTTAHLVQQRCQSHSTVH